MSEQSNIEWTDASWNVVTGCTRVSEGCRHCYAERLTATRLRENPRYAGLAVLNGDGDARWTSEVRCHDDLLDVPLRWRNPRRVFVCSMSDLFHPDVPFEFIDKVFAVMALCPQHTFQVLTKRPERMAEYHHDRDWGDAANSITNNLIRRLDGALYFGGEIIPPLPNVWLGTSVEDQPNADERIPHLLKCPATVRFLSVEPLLGPVDLHDAFYRPRLGPNDPYKRLQDIILIHWVIVGGESGPGARPMDPAWARSIRDQCVAAGVPFFFKQWGQWMPRGNQMRSVGKYAAGRVLDGRTWDEMPQGAVA